MDSKNYPPYYLQLSHTLITIALLAAGLYLGQGILIPFFFSILLAILLLPVVNYLVSKKMDRIVAILFVIVISLSVIATVVYFLSSQIGSFLDDIPTLKNKLQELAFTGKKWVQETFNIAIREQNKYLKDTAQKMSDNGTGIVQQTFLTLTEIISYLVFLPVYTFLLLYHKDMIKHFLIKVFKRAEEDTITEILYESQNIGQRYLTGLLIELVIVFTLNSTGFVILGIKYPIFLALVAALLNLVPYIGMLIANLFCMLITLVSSESTADVLWVCGVLAAVQVIDNNILMPYVVGTKIKLNSLVIILGVLIGGALCGVPGMFLAIPGIAVMKVIFERVPDLKPWAILLGDETTIRMEKNNPVKSAVTTAKEDSKKG